MTTPWPSRRPAWSSCTAPRPHSTASTSASPRAPSPPCWGPTAPARPRPSASSRPCPTPPPAPPPSPASTWLLQANEVRRRIGLAAQDATIDPLLTGRENLVMIGEAAPARRGEAKARRRAARAVRPHRRRRAGDLGYSAACVPPARPGGHWRACSPVPRRADHGSRPPGPQRAVDRARHPRRAGHDAAAHHAVPGGGRPPRRRHPGRRPRQGHRPRRRPQPQAPGRRRQHRRDRRRPRRPGPHCRAAGAAPTATRWSTARCAPSPPPPRPAWRAWPRSPTRWPAPGCGSRTSACASPPSTRCSSR